MCPKESMSSGLWKVGNVDEEFPLLVQAGMADDWEAHVPGDGAAEASSAKTASGDRGRKESRKSLKGGVGKKSSVLASRPSCVVGSCGSCFSASGA